MGRSKPNKESPAVKKAREVKKKYAKTSPGKSLRCRRALMAIEKKEVTIREASKAYGLSYGYLHRRLSGDVEIDSRNGPQPVFTKIEEESMAHWLQEMASRGMGLKPVEFLDFVQQIVTKEKKKTPFVNNRPAYDWYYAFLERNSHILEMRTETPLETCRAKLTKEKTDQWYISFKDFLLSKGLIDKPNCIWNADETGFSMGSVSGKVIGPTRAHHPSQVPHLSGGHSKQRLTVMFCGSADGTMMPPYFVYPEPKPRGYNPLTGAIYGSDIAYTKKGWMDSSTFEKFLDHFHAYAGEERPVVLLIDSVSSHISMSAFELASKRGIELYRIVPNATHLMQPLDVGVFGLLKQKWHQVVRAHTRNSPGVPIGKSNFAEKLKEAFLLFYKPLTVINAFRSSGVYPVDGTVITKDKVKPGVTFSCTESREVESCSVSDCSPCEAVATSSLKQPSGSLLALQALERALTTPTKYKYTQRLQEGYDVEKHSPCFDVYKKLLSETRCETVANKIVLSENSISPIVKPVETVQCENSADGSICGLDLLATAASECCQKQSQYSVLSPTMKEALTFPAAKEKKIIRKSQLDELPDNLTSADSLRKMSLKSLSKIRAFSERETKAKKRYMSQVLKKSNKTKSRNVKSISKSNEKRARNASSGKRKFLKSNKSDDTLKNAFVDNDSDNVSCMYCEVTWAQDQEVDVERVWVQCDLCDQWLHADCNEGPVVTDDDFYCDKCKNQ